MFTNCTKPSKSSRPQDSTSIMANDVSPSPEIVRPSPYHKMTPEEEETFQKKGGLKENDVILHEVIDPVRNCLLKRETLKVVRVADVSIAADTPLELKVLKREEFFVGNEYQRSNERVLSKKPGKPGKGGGGGKSDLIFDAIKWTYDLLKDSTGIDTKDCEASALAKDTTWQDYYGSKYDKEEVTERWVMWPFGNLLVGATVRIDCYYMAKPRSDTGIQGFFLSNVVGKTTWAYAALGHSISASASIKDKVDMGSRDFMIPEMDLTITFVATELGLLDHRVSHECKVSGADGVRRL